MRFRYQPKKPKDLTEWHLWFAWHPVRVSGHVVWLERLRRKGQHYPDSLGGFWVFEYDFPVVYY